MTSSGRFAVCVALTACTSSTPVLAPILDQPVNASASAFPLDDVTMEVAHEDAAFDIASATFGSGQNLELGGIPFADDLAIYLTGYVQQDPVAYGRTCDVVVAANTAVPQPHLYFSEISTFGQLVPVPATVRFGGAAVADDVGGGVVLGGADGSGSSAAAVTEVERFDPLSGALVPNFASLTPRIGAAISAIGSGTQVDIVVLGGLDPTTGSAAQFVEQIDPDQTTPARRVTTIDDAQTARTGLTATELSDGSVVVIGGSGASSGPPVPTTEIDDVVLASDGTATISEQHAVLAIARYGHSATRLGSDVDAAVLIAGGIDANGSAIGSAEEYLPLGPTISPSFEATMINPRTQHQALAMPDGSVLFVGGVDGSGNPVTQLELFTRDGGGFTNIGPLPADAGVVDFAATTLPDGRVLLTGGRLTPGGPPLDTAYIAALQPGQSPPVGLFPTVHMITPRAGHQATLLCDGTVILSGGTTTPVPLERYNPSPDNRR
jgi:hypothetical protein